jgi:branched-chain amino acid transport system ATP-binding protein
MSGARRVETGWRAYDFGLMLVIGPRGRPVGRGQGRGSPVAMLEIAGLTKRFGGFTAVSEVSFTVNEGEILGLIGPNGSGKSTTFNCIAGMYPPTAGTIRLEGRDIADLPAYRVCHAGIGRTYQIPRPFRNLSVLENVALSAWFGQQRTVTRERCWQQAADALRLVGLAYEGGQTTQGLGAAALKKLELARALATQPRLLLADESLNGLDHAEMDQAADMLQRIRKEHGITIVWVEHIMGVLMRVVDRVVVLDHGEKIFDGSPEKAQSDRRVIEVYLGTDKAA